jgi:Flp pilus assembly protein TadD
LASKTDQELYSEAQQMADCGALVEARAQLEALAKRQPQNSKIQNDLGVICYKLGDLASAQRFYENAVCLQPDDAIFVRNLADLYFVELNRVDDAIQMYLELYRKNPRDVETLINIGHICAAVGRGEEANSFYRRALEIEPWNNDARAGLAGPTQSASPVTETKMGQSLTAEELVSEARRMMDQGQPVQARDLLEQALATSPHYAVAHNDLGVVAYSLGDLGAAQVAYEQAVKLQPDNPDFRKNLADLYFVAVGRTDDAIQIYLELFRQFPRDIEVLSALGQICQAVGRPEEAKTFFRRVLEIEPWNKEVREILQGQI